MNGLLNKNKKSGIGKWIDRLLYKDESEALESPTVPMAKRIGLVDALSRVNHVSGYNAHFIQQLHSLVEAIPERKPTDSVKILDIGCGGGGLLYAIDRWAKKKNINAELFGLDLNEDFVRATQAKLRAQKVSVSIFKGDATRLQFEKDSFDIVISSYILHHVRGDEKVASMLSEIRRVAKHGWLVMDLNRKFRGIAFMWLGLFIGEPLLLIFDGIKSLRRAYTSEEINQIVKEFSGTKDLRGMICEPYKLFPHWRIKGIKR
jgi:ubiquinone/menaquinone biosynthesis C-methylase UbiE